MYRFTRENYTPSNEATRQPAHPAAIRFWGIAACVTLVLLGLYLLTTGGQTYISDGELMLQTAVRIAEEHTLTLPETAAAFPQTVRGQGGFLFSRYGIGQPMVAAVLYLVGSNLVELGLLPGSLAVNVGRFFALLLPALATAVTGGVLYVWAARLYESVRMGVVLALLYGIGTLAWPYSRFFFSEPLFTCCCMLAAYALHARAPLLAGLPLGYALATRIGGVFVLPAFAVYAWLSGQRWQGFGWLGLGMLPGSFLIVVNNWVRFRAFTEQGYGNEGFTGNLLEGLVGLLFSPGKSLFLYVPLLIALPFAVPAFARRLRVEAIFIGLLTIITLVQSSLWWIWWAGWGWGPRFLVPLLPFLTLPLGGLLYRQQWRRLICLVLLPLSIAVNLLGILVDFNPYLSAITQGDMNREQLYLWQPAYSPLLAHITRFDLTDVQIVSFQLSRSDLGFAEPAATVLPFMVVLTTVGAVGGLIWLLRDASGVTSDA